MKRIGILGAGTWGMALARMLTVSGNDVLVWSAIEKEIDDLSTTRVHPNLPQMKIPEELRFTKSIEEVCKDKDILLFAVPSVFVRTTAALHPATMTIDSTYNMILHFLFIKFLPYSSLSSSLVYQCFVFQARKKTIPANWHGQFNRNWTFLSIHLVLYSYASTLKYKLLYESDRNGDFL